MVIEVSYKKVRYKCDLRRPLDISIPMGQVRCFYAPEVKLTPFESGDFIGSVRAGAPVNFYNVGLNPHGNGTHTEGLGHITLDQEPLSACLTQYHFISQLISVEIEQLDNEDWVISESELKRKYSNKDAEALILRTLPNTTDKTTKDYSGTNPPYLTEDAMKFIVSKGVKHLLIDLPSVDREEDDGRLVNHKLYWNLKTNSADEDAYINHTITELIYVPNNITDGLYLLNIQVPSIKLDATPSKPTLYHLTQN